MWGCAGMRNGSGPPQPVTQSGLQLLGSQAKPPCPAKACLETEEYSHGDSGQFYIKQLTLATVFVSCFSLSLFMVLP